MTSLSKLLLFAFPAVLVSGCSAIHIPALCHNRPKAFAEKAALLPSGPNDFSRPFIEEELAGLSRSFTVFIPRVCYLSHSLGESPPLVDASRPPVLLCEELFTLSPAVLELGQRLASEGFAVYIPILFGDAREDPNSKWLAIQRYVSFAFAKPDWKANVPAASERPIIHELAGLCRSIAKRHPGKKMGAIGLCISGSFPLELLCEAPIVAPVLSQPAMPVVAFDFYRRQSLGMSDEKMQAVRSVIVDRHLSVLGFRFQLDPISPPERFAHLRYLLGPAFIDATLPASDYIYRDKCPANAHAVLTDGFCPWLKGEREKRGHFAYRQLVWFLKTRLEGTSLAEPVYDPNAIARHNDSFSDSDFSFGAKCHP